MQKVSDNFKRKNLDYLLDEAYDEALENENFKEFVSKLKIKREVLKKYTSILEECSEEYHNCQNCLSLAACQNKITGYAKLPKLVNGVLEFGYRPCKYKKKLDKEEKGLFIYNLGTGKGYSVLDMVKAFESATGKKVPYKIAPRRAGDIATCYADPKKAKEELGWEATKTLEDMCKDSWNYIVKNS